MFFYAHSGIRYIILLLGVMAAGYALYGVLTRKEYTPLMQKLGSWFAVSLHIQFLMGFAVLLSGRFSPALIGHIFMMLMAAAVAQIVSSVLRRKPMEERTYLPHLVGSIVALALVAGGILAIGRPILGSGL